MRKFHSDKRPSITWISRLALPAAVAAMGLMGQARASAAVTFSCDGARGGEECSFTLFDERGGEFNFALDAQASHTFGDRQDDKLGGVKYCVAVVKKDRPNPALDPNDIPNCWKGTRVKVNIPNR